MIRVDQRLESIARSLLKSRADVEIARTEQLGGLAVAAFDRIAGAREDVRRFFSSEAVEPIRPVAHNSPHTPGDGPLGAVDNLNTNRLAI